MSRLSLRALLIGLYLGTVIPLLVGLGLALHLEYRLFLIDEHRSTMRDLLDALVVPRGVVVTPTLPRLAGLVNEQLRDTDFAAVLLDPAGRPVGAVGRVPLLSAAEHAALRAGAAPISREVETTDGTQMIYARAVATGDGRALGTIEGRFPVAAVRPELERLTGWLAATIGIALACVIALAPLVARLATRPLRSLMTTARAVSQGRLDARAGLSPVREPRELALTVNAMLDRLQRTLDTEARTAAALRRFAADASHELRSPLAVFGNGLELLAEALRRDDAAQVQETLARLGREQETMRRLVDDLLLLARVDQPDISDSPLRRAPVEPLPLLEEVAERAQLLATGQRLRLQWPSRLPPTLEADPEALKRALNNLVENALRHTPPGTTVTLSVLPEGAMCRFTVADTGEGIAPEHLPHLGERFYRPDAARERTGGAGLGLAIVTAIAAAHGGRLELTSALGQVTTAHLIIPLRPPAAAPRPAWLPPAPLATEAITTRLAAPRGRLRRRRALLAGATGLVALSSLGLLVVFGREAASSSPSSDSAQSAGVLLVAEPTPTTTLAATATAPSSLSSPREPEATQAFPTALPATPPSSPGPLDLAAAIAAEHVGGVALAVAYEDGKPGPVAEVTLSDGGTVIIDLGSAVVLEVEAGPQGRGRGVERQRLERAAVAAAVIGGATRIGFDTAAASARSSVGRPREVTLKLVEGRLVYAVRGRDDFAVLVDASTGVVVASPAERDED